MSRPNADFAGERFDTDVYQESFEDTASIQHNYTSTGEYVSFDSVEEYTKKVNAYIDTLEAALAEARETCDALCDALCDAVNDLELMFPKA